MNDKILEKLIEYIDAAIDEKLDDFQSSDGGIISCIAKNRIRE